jgi:glycosyltransferase involved in cell wall biosynthesis/GT2 family glycosyltransferase
VIGNPPSVSVIVPTFRRPQLLRQCLAALGSQTVAPDEIVVVHRTEDEETAAALRDSKNQYRIVTVDEPGVLAALEAGVRATTGDLVAFLDDDTAPRPDWLERLRGHFADTAVGAVGGRDVVHLHQTAQLPLTENVGRITRWGKLIGNHHLGTGPVQDVDVLKGCNMAFRREALALPRSLRGSGAQVHFEVAVCTWARSQGWRLVYDPELLVDHFPGPRFDEDRREQRTKAAIRDASHNLVFALLSVEPDLFMRRSLFGLVVGDRGNPGLIRAAAAVLWREPEVIRALLPSLAGQAEALLDLVRGRRLELARFDSTNGPRHRQRPKVVLVAHDIHDGGGMERAFAELIRGAHGKVDFAVVSGRVAPDLEKIVEWHRVWLPQKPFPLKFTWFFVAGGLKLRRLDADIIHTLGAIVPNRADVACVQFCHAGFRDAVGRLVPPGTPPLRRLNTAVARALALTAERWCYRPSRVRALAPVSAGTSRELGRHYPGVPIVVIPNGVDLERFRPDDRARRNLRATEGIGDNTVVTLFLGGDWRRKGLDVAIEGAARAVELGADLRLWVVGQGDEARAAALARSAGVGDRVRFFGPRADTERFYAASDVFVLPSLYEAFALVSLEAAACGLPLVASAANGVQELTGENEAGILVDRTPASVGEALARLALSPGERRRMGDRARTRAREFTWDRSVTGALALFGSLANQATPAATEVPA